MHRDEVTRREILYGGEATPGMGEPEQSKKLKLLFELNKAHTTRRLGASSASTNTFSISSPKSILKPLRSTSPAGISSSVAACVFLNTVCAACWARRRTITVCDIAKRRALIFEHVVVVREGEPVAVDVVSRGASVVVIRERFAGRGLADIKGA